MNSKDFGEIRKLLGRQFHLCISYDNLINPKWSLYRNYIDSKVYFSEDNEVIMSSETNTIDELYEYAKKHNRIDEHFFIGKMFVIIASILFISMIINEAFFHNEMLTGFILGGDIMIICYSSISHIIWNNNYKVEMLELKENYDRRFKND